MRNGAILLGGESLVPLAPGALYAPKCETAIVSDLHFEKGAAYARRGVPLPPYDTAATLQALEALVERLRPRRLVALGDSFHDADGWRDMAAPDRARLVALCGATRWTWIVGNHDPEPPEALGEVTESLSLGAVTLRHEPAEEPEGPEIAGHFHPCASVTVRGRRLRRRCFARDSRRLIMPAFGAYTGGLDVAAPVLRRLFGADFSVLMLGRGRVYPFSAGKLCA